MSRKRVVNRRQFLGFSAGSIGAGTFGLRESRSGGETPKEAGKIKEYRVLGRTGFEVSDLSAGTGLSAFDPSILSAVLDAGVNYIDTGEGYGNGRAETTIGEVIKKRDRKSLVLTTKLNLLRGKEKESLLARARKALERMQTDYVDCLMVHNALTVEMLSTSGFHEAMDQLKKEGRVRYVGVTCHGMYGMEDPQDSMEKLLLAAAEDGRFDVMLLAYNFLAREMGEKILRACSEKNIGATLMKTNPVAEYHELKSRVEEEERGGRKATRWMKITLPKFKEQVDQAEGSIQRNQLNSLEEIRKGALRFVLSNENVHTVCLSFHNFDLVDTYLSVSGSRIETADSGRLSEFARDCGSLYCRHGCGLCESRCPHGIPVNTIMRFNHYFVAQGCEKLAMTLYKDLPMQKADRCRTCEGNCQAACPFGVSIQPLLVLAHERLTLA